MAREEGDLSGGDAEFRAAAGGFWGGRSQPSQEVIDGATQIDVDDPAGGVIEDHGRVAAA
jgi:hypothetical protein